jgi:polar amino acid transport system substrate-binding protein
LKMKWHQVLAAAGLVMLAACAQIPADTKLTARAQLAATGKLRLGVVAPAPASPSAVQELSGTNRSMAELGAELAQTLGVALELVRYPSTGELTDAVTSGAWDVAFLLVDPEREKVVAFGPGFFLTEIACLVSATANIRGVEDLDRQGTRLVVIENTTTQRTLAGKLRHATLLRVRSADEQYELLRSGQADAAAATRFSMHALAARLPGARVLPENIHTTTVAVAVRRNRPAALAYVSEFLDKAKRSGNARRALDNAGLRDVALAPP